MEFKFRLLLTSPFNDKLANPFIGEHDSVYVTRKLSAVSCELSAGATLFKTF